MIQVASDALDLSIVDIYQTTLVNPAFGLAQDLFRKPFRQGRRCTSFQNESLSLDGLRLEVYAPRDDIHSRNMGRDGRGIAEGKGQNERRP